MVRFARAKGSKASNERVPEQASSWQEIKQQMIDAQHKKSEWDGEDINVSIKDDGFIKSEWATFEENEPKSTKRRRIYENISKRSLAHVEENCIVLQSQTEKKRKTSVIQLSSAVNNGMEEQANAKKSLSSAEGDSEEIQQSSSKKKKKKKKVRSDSVVSDGINECTKTNMPSLLVGESGEETQLSRSKMNSGIQNVTPNKCEKKHNEKCVKAVHIKKSLSEESQEGHGMKDENVNISSSQPKAMDGQQETERFVPKRTRKRTTRKQNFSSGYKRKYPYDPMFKTINIEGRLVEICEFGHYKIRREDWDLLQDLQKEMREKNLPEDEIQKALKKERRRAEKCLARERKKVCYHCREPGHLLTECPSINAEGDFRKHRSIIPKSTNVSVCFKCGSTEHSYLQCRVVSDNEFRFATCFVCGEEGHLSRQCPDNPRGIYPKGGGCKTCGDVTHLVKDCPQFQCEQQQQSTALTLPTLNDTAALEALDEDSPKPERKTSKTSHNKVVKF